MEKDSNTKRCTNEGCINTFTFRKNKRFCCNKCRNAFHNRETEKHLSAHNGILKKLKKAGRTLGILMKKMETLKIKSVSSTVLQLFDIPLYGYLDIEKNKDTEKPIWWYGDYGIEVASKEPLQYFIHKK